MNINEANRLFRKYNLDETECLCFKCTGRHKCNMKKRIRVDELGECLGFESADLTQSSINHLCNIQSGIDHVTSEYYDEINSIKENINMAMCRIGI